ncbi:MAG: quinolinate synthase NadA [Bacteroidia bacterium]|nr:quinolinate synthase NadA [Bacteroidia bacterium]
MKKVDMEIKTDKFTDYAQKIRELKSEKNAVILGHYYQIPEIQDVSDFVGDSLALAQKAATTPADIIVFAGVHFMAETAKILNPHKKVLLPDMNAGCSLADSIPADKFEEFKKNYPGYTVVSYVNTSAAIKALSDIVCTSSNAKQIVESLPADEKIIFAPDKNLGNYINSITGRNMILWNGACHVHEKFSLEKILDLKKQYPDSKIISHPECERPVLLVSDFIGSTSSLLNYVVKSEFQIFIVATESGIIHQMQKACPHKKFIPAPPNDSTCACNDCQFMKMNTLEKLYLCLRNEYPEIIIEEKIRIRAELPIRRMLEISQRLEI